MNQECHYTSDSCSGLAGASSLTDAVIRISPPPASLYRLGYFVLHSPVDAALEVIDVVGVLAHSLAFHI